MARLPLLLLLLVVGAAAHGGVDHGDDDAAAPDLRSKSLILVKIWCLILVFAGTFAGGVSPYFLKWNEGFLVLGTQFAGGVFLGTALMHFLSDSNGTFGDLTDVNYPFAFMLASAGYVITMLADCLILMVVTRGRSVKDVEAEEGEGKVTNSNENRLPNSRTQVPSINLLIYGLTTSTSESLSMLCGLQTQPQLQAEDRTHNQSTASMLRDSSSLRDSVLLIAALCFHSVFEGIAIGVAETKADAWKAMWTVSLHKIFAAIAMGIALLRMLPNRPLLSCAAYAFAFAVSSPIGVAIGIVIDATTEGRVADWIYAISMGLACGIFVYVSINHLLAKGYKPRRPVAVDSPLFRWVAAVLGVGVIAVVMIWDT